ncbi:arylsulfatase [Reichenbachiella carrageenanivorans]|uniref:Arylsulfatase n=1 Tax=Reichenbachiella carrageenanivorans TaxID=2979869 RepID=A0ABY6D484_9BACT|nr:arylsulfatase [Reichenbachiella carrageenanivorans]UXX80969.1 arylsulfatase [Reichenbachiella carrageenanivorans]
MKTNRIIWNQSWVAIVVLSMWSCAKPAEYTTDPIEKPNIIYILADDLGYGDLGCYGQTKIATPNIDQLAADGMLFTQHYSGSTVCAPSRSVLLTGLHTGHTFVRSNREYGDEGQFPLKAEATTIPEVLKTAGYTTGAFGKWGLGFVGTEGDPNKQGFDQFYGYNCQAYAHRYYPTYLWDNSEKVILEGNDWTNKKVYAADLIHNETLDFIRDNKENPFFLYVASVIPHAELVAPNDSILSKYEAQFQEETPWGFNNTSGSPYRGNDYGAEDFEIQGYAPIKNPHATFAAMVTRLDQQVGEIVALVKSLGLEEKTMIVFTSDNGPHKEGGADPDFFNSYGPNRGYKRDLYEGGIRVPMIVSWPSVVDKGSITNHISGFWDILPTAAELAGATPLSEVDGLSLVPLLKGNKKDQKNHEYMYWEFHEQGGKQAVRVGDWKGVRVDVIKSPHAKIELYNLKNDPKELKNLADELPGVVAEISVIMNKARTHNEDFPFISGQEINL